MPAQDAVVAITSGTRDLQGVLNLVWEHLLPGMMAEPLPADAPDHDRLAKKLAGLTLPPQPGRATSPVALQVSGQIYELAKNDDGLEAIGLVTGPETTLVLRSGGRESRVPCGRGEWRRAGTLPLGKTLRAGGVNQPVATSGAWTADDTYTVKACLYETPFCSTLALWFAGRALVLDQEVNVGFGPTKRPQLVGRPRPTGAAASAPAATPLASR
jgi:hypothetical protein